MIQVSKDEVKKIRAEFPHIHIKRTVNKYYVEENIDVMEAIGRKPKRRW